MQRRDYAVALLITTVVLLLGAWRLVPRVSGVFHDDAIYVTTAKALAEGEGYHLINLPGSPRQTKYPIVYPAVLALIWKVWPRFPDNVLAMQVLTLLAAAAAVGGSYLYLVRFGYCSRLTATCAVLVSATTPTLLYTSTLTLSEMPFALLLLAALWRLDLDLQKPRSRLGQFCTGLLLAAPYLCRSVGLSIVIAALALLGWHRKPLRWTVAGAAAAMFPWFTWTLLGTTSWLDDPIIGYYTDYRAGYTPFSAQGVVVFAINLLLLCRDSIGLAMTGVQEAADAAGIRFAKWLVLPGAVGWAYVARRSLQYRPLPWVLLLYGVMICLWPWPPWRFLVPILPLLVSQMAQALSSILSSLLPRGSHGYVLGVAASIAILFNVMSVTSAARVNRETGYPHQFAPGAFGESQEPVAWASFEETFRWVRANVPQRDVVATGLDTMLNLYTGHQAFRPWVHRPQALFYGARVPKTGSPDEFLTIVKSHGARYLILFPMENFSEAEPLAELVSQVREQRPDALVPVYQGADPRFVVFRIREDPEPKPH